MFARSQFAQAGAAFARQHPQWTWVNNARPGYGYLTRTRTSLINSSVLVDASLADPDIELSDPATANVIDSTGVVQEYIVYSASFNVPAFYFLAYNTNGSPMTLKEIIQSPYFKFELSERTETTPFAVTPPTSPFPLLSQGDHPTLDLPCWYFHPCESEKAVEEFMRDIADPDWTEEQRWVRWMEIWLMLVGSVLNV